MTGTMDTSGGMYSLRFFFLKDSATNTPEVILQEIEAFYKIFEEKGIRVEVSLDDINLKDLNVGDEKILVKSPVQHLIVKRVGLIYTLELEPVEKEGEEEEKETVSVTDRPETFIFYDDFTVREILLRSSQAAENFDQSLYEQIFIREDFALDQKYHFGNFSDKEVFLTISRIEEEEKEENEND